SEVPGFRGSRGADTRTSEPRNSGTPEPPVESCALPIPLTPEARRRWAWRLAVALVVGYAAWLRLVILVERFGPFDHPGWLVTLSHVVEAPKPALAPASWVWAKSDPPY